MTDAASLAGAEGGHWASQPIPKDDGDYVFWRSVLKGFLVLSIVVAIAGLLVYRSARDSVTVAVTSNLQAIATLKATQIDHWLDEKGHDIRSNMLAELDRPPQALAIRQWLRTRAYDPILHARLLNKLQQIKLAHRYLKISLRSAQDGSLLLATGDEEDTPAARALVLATANNGKAVREDFHIEDTGGMPRFHIGFIDRISIGKDPDTVVVVDVKVDASEVLYPMIQHWPGWNISAETLLLRRDGNDIIVLNGQRQSVDKAIHLDASTARSDSINGEALKVGTGALQGNGFLNQPAFAYALPIPHTPWILVAEVGEDGAYAKLNTIAALTTALVTLLMLACAWWLLEQHRSTIARVRHEAERKLLTTRINYLAKQANDCIILCNESGRIMEVNDRCASTYGYTQEELLEMNLGDLHTADRRPEVQTVLLQITAEYGLIHESEHLRKDGSAFDVEISTNVMDIDGKPCFQAIIRDISVRKKLELEREEHLRRLSELTRRLVNVQEEERRLLSGELHDQVGANLATMNLNLRSIRNMLAAPRPQRLEDMLTDTGALLADTISSIRDYCADLRPAILDYSGLIPALQQLVQRFGPRSGIVTRFREEGMHERLPHLAESMLFRIAQEALTNCAKHSSANTIELAIAKQMQFVVLTVSDDGKGFDPQMLVGSSRAGLGLLTMRERAAMAGGMLSVISSPGNGTQIRVVVECSVEQQEIHEQDLSAWLNECQEPIEALRRLA